MLSFRLPECMRVSSGSFSGQFQIGQAVRLRLEFQKAQRKKSTAIMCMKRGIQDMHNWFHLPNMRPFLLAFAMVAAWTAVVCAEGVDNGAITSIHAIHTLTKAQAQAGLPVAFEATVTYYNKSGHRPLCAGWRRSDLC